MEVTTKELRIQPGKIIGRVVDGQEVTVTFRGKALAKIVPIKKAAKKMSKDEPALFGLWKDRADIENVDEYVREMRKGRQF